MKIFYYAFLLALIIPFTYAAEFAREGNTKLLAVSEENNTITGSLADLHLKIKDGSGKVYIETFPFTKLDTQITTRFAKQIACSYLNIDCNKFDFFYTIRAGSAIVGGPSAGAATTLLTISLLKDLEIRKDVAITGTINSGNIIGPVGGLKEKIDAASLGGIKKVLIPKGQKIIIEDNQTINLEEYAKEKGIIVVEVSDIDDALQEFYGKRFKKNNKPFEINKEYLKTMKFISENLCNSANDVFENVLKKNYAEGKVLSNESLSLEEEADNHLTDAQIAYNDGRYYSAASFCYGAYVKYNQISLIERNLSISDLRKEIESLQEKMINFEIETKKRKINTITDLETYMIVKDRLDEANDYLIEAKKAINERDSMSAIFFISNVRARLYSANLWSHFFGKPGLRIRIDDEALNESCKEKISEAEERYQYFSLSYPNSGTSIKESIKKAYTDFGNKEFTLCLFDASKAKAEADTILSFMNVDINNVGLLLDQKINSSKKILAEQIAKGIFPIFGYSYYEYANSLKNKNTSSAFLYAEYAIELSNLDMYFKQKERSRIEIDWNVISIFFSGFIIGLFAYEIIFIWSRRRPKTKRSR